MPPEDMTPEPQQPAAAHTLFCGRVGAESGAHCQSKDLLLITDRIPKNRHRFVDGGLLADGNELGLHETAGRVLGEGEKGLDLVPVLPWQGLDDIGGDIIGKIRDDVRGVVRGHLLDGVGELLRQQMLSEVIPEVIGEFLHEIRDPGDVESLEQRWPELVGKHTEEGCEISVVGADHAKIWFQVTARLVEDSSSVRSFTGHEDLSGLRSALQRVGSDPWQGAPSPTFTRVIGIHSS